MKAKKGKSIRIAVIAALAVIVVMVIVIAVFVNSPAQKYRKQLELAERYLEDLDYDQAIAAYRAAIEIDPKNPEAFEALAELYIDQGEYEEALEILNAGIKETEDEDLRKLASKTETRIAEAEAAKRASGESENATGMQGEGRSGTGSEATSEDASCPGKKRISEIRYYDYNSLEDYPEIKYDISLRKHQEI